MRQWRRRRRVNVWCPRFFICVVAMLVVLLKEYTYINFFLVYPFFHFLSLLNPSATRMYFFFLPVTSCHSLLLTCLLYIKKRNGPIIEPCGTPPPPSRRIFLYLVVALCLCLCVRVFYGCCSCLVADRHVQRGTSGIYGADSSCLGRSCHRCFSKQRGLEGCAANHSLFFFWRDINVADCLTSTPHTHGRLTGNSPRLVTPPSSTIAKIAEYSALSPPATFSVTFFNVSNICVTFFLLIILILPLLPQFKNNLI